MKPWIWVFAFILTTTGIALGAYLSDLTPVAPLAGDKIGIGRSKGAGDKVIDIAGIAAYIQGQQSSVGRVRGIPITKAAVGLGDVPNLDATNPANIIQDATHRFATDAEKDIWASKQDALTEGIDYLTPTGNGSELTGLTAGQVGAAAAGSSPSNAVFNQYTSGNRASLNGKSAFGTYSGAVDDAHRTHGAADPNDGTLYYYVLKGGATCPAGKYCILPGDQTYVDIVALWSGTGDYLRADGTLGTPSGSGGGTVNSVAMSVPTGFAISGSPITDTGTLALSFAGGYSLPSDSTQSGWTAKQPALSLLPGTYANGNICTYASSGTLLNCNTATSTFQAALVSGTNIKTVGGGSLIGSGDIGIIGSAYGGTGNGYTKFSGPTGTEKTFTLPDASASLAYTVASNTVTLGTGAIASGACAAAITVAGTGIATTDVIDWGFNGDPTGVTGYIPTTDGMLTIIAYPTSGNANFKVCNNTGASITPGAITLNWRVRR